MTQAPSARSANIPSMGGAILLVLVVCCAYVPALRGQFLWDDDLLITNNALVKAPDGLYRMWFTTEPVDYWPVSNSSLWFEWRIWGADTTGYHVVSLLLHIACCFLIWGVLRKLAVPGAFLAALLFAVHPVNVEAVAWIAQRKTLLAALFFWLSILGYLKALPAREATSRLVVLNQARWYWLSLAAFVLGMLSKGSIALEPAVLLLIGWWIHGRITRQDVLRSGPFFLAAVPLVIVNVWFQTHGTGEVIRSAGFLERLLGAATALWFYLFKALVPVNLIYIYPQWSIDPTSLVWWLPLGGAAALAALLAWRRNTDGGRALIFAAAFFVFALLPVLGFADVYFMKFALVADHYQYLALVAVVALAAAVWQRWFARAGHATRTIALALAVLIVSVATGLTWRQAGTYADLETLYRIALEKNPDCWVIHDNLGVELDGRNPPQRDEAIDHFETALRLKPDYAKAHFDLGNALLASGRAAEAVDHFETAARLHPNDSNVQLNLGVTLEHLGRTQEAIASFQEAVRLQPSLAAAHNNLGNELRKAGKLDEALAHLEQAVQLKPDYLEAWGNLAFTHDALDHPQQARAAAQQALAVARARGNASAVAQIEAWLQSHAQGPSEPPSN